MGKTITMPLSEYEELLDTISKLNGQVQDMTNLNTVRISLEYRNTPVFSNMIRLTSGRLLHEPIIEWKTIVNNPQYVEWKDRITKDMEIAFNQKAAAIEEAAKIIASDMDKIVRERNFILEELSKLRYEAYDSPRIPKNKGWLRFLFKQNERP